MQLVISLGGRRDPEMFHNLPGEPLVVRDAPQLQLLKRAQVVITHAGPNTVFETLMEGKPMIAIPEGVRSACDCGPPGMAGCGRGIAIEELSARQIRAALMKVLNEPSYRDAAKELQARMRLDRGLERAADVIEEAIERDIVRLGISKSNSAGDMD